MRRLLSRYARSERGASVVELAFALFLLTIPILNVVDLAFYGFTWMQTENAAQMGAQAAFSNCNTANSLPASLNCYKSNSANNMTLFDAVNQGIAESTLNNTVTLTNSNVVDGYYCSTSGNVLTQVGNLGYAFADSNVIGASANSSDVTPTNSGTSCGAGYADTTASPGEYVRVDVTHSYTSIFPGVTVVSFLPTTMTATAYARLD